MPVGVRTSTSVKSAPTVVPAGPSARFFTAGVTERGPVGSAVRVRSLTEFEAVFGGAVSFSNLHEHMRVFYGEGGYEAHVTRLVGPAAAKASASLDTGKIVVTAKDEGGYANGWTAAYTSATKTLTVVTDRGTETYTGADLAGLLAAAAASTTVTVTSSGTLPASNVAAVSLAGGADDRANITASGAMDAVNAAFTSDLGAGAIAIPGYTAAQVGADLLVHARANKRVALLATARTDSLSAAQSAAAAARTGDSEGNGGVFWPWLLTPSGATISPESAVAGRRASVIRAAGPWVAPAGGNGVLTYVAGLDQKATRAQVDVAHDDYALNVITTISGGPRVYGWRALSLDAANFRYLSYRDTLNMIRVNVETVLEPYVYAPMSQALAQNAVGSIIGVLTPLIRDGGLYPLLDDDGNVVDEGYQVGVDMSVGPNGEGILTPSVSVRIVPAAELINVPITKVAVGATLA